jgi:hypothetical protein
MMIRSARSEPLGEGRKGPESRCNVFAGCVSGTVTQIALSL